MTHNKTIGLIGGMSWESTIPYYSYSCKEGCRDGTEVKNRSLTVHGNLVWIFEDILKFQPKV